MNNAVTNGNQMIGASFTTVGAQDAKGNSVLLLSQIKPTGYEDNEGMQEDAGTWGDFSFQIRNTNGKAVEAYQWYQDYDDTEGWLEGYWHAVNSGADISTENDVQFYPGNGFWFTVGSDYGKINGALVNSGTAVIAAQNVAITNGNNAVAIPVSFDVKLYADNIKPTGYEDNEGMQEDAGTWGDFSFQILNTNGKAVEAYQWYQDYDDTEGWLEGYWHAVNSGADISFENDVTLKAGMGLWFTIGSDYGTIDGGLEFPGVDDEKRTE